MTLEQLSTYTDAQTPPSVRALDVFGRAPTSLVLPLNRKTTQNDVREIPLTDLEPTQTSVAVGGLEAYLTKPRRDPPDVAHVVMQDGRERWLIQEGHTRLGASVLRGETRLPARVWEFEEDAAGKVQPVPRGLHKRGVTYRDKLLALANPVGVNQWGGPDEWGKSGHGDGRLAAGKRVLIRERVGKARVAYNPGDLTGAPFTIYNEAFKAGSKYPKAVTVAAVEVAKAMGVPLERVHIEDLSNQVITLNGRQGRIAGYFDPATKRLVMDATVPPQNVTEILTHEASHAVFHEATTSTTPEGKAFREFLTVFKDDLQKADGVTDYSAAYWMDHTKTADVRVNETLAELSTLKVSQRGAADDLVPTSALRGGSAGAREAVAKGATMTAPDIRARVRGTPAVRGKASGHYLEPVAPVWIEAHRLMFEAADAERARQAKGAHVGSAP